jgi:hypothetical protein
MEWENTGGKWLITRKLGKPFGSHVATKYTLL